MDQTFNTMTVFYQNGYTLTNNLAVSGGSDLVTSRFSISHLDNEGIVQGSDYERYTINSLSSLTSNNLTVNLKANYVQENSINRTNHGDFPSNPGKAFINVPTNISADLLRNTVRNNDLIDRTRSAIPWNNNVFIPNPFWGNQVNQQRDTRRRITGFVSAKYDFFEDIAYKHRFGKIGVTSNLGGGQNKRSRETYGIGGGAFIIPEIYHINNLEFKSPPSFRPLRWQTNGLYANTTVDYENYIFVEGSLRQEWYSTLTARPQLGENSALYWSTSITGISYTGRFGPVPVGEVANKNARGVDTYPNPFLKVTRTRAFEVGIEAGMLKDRLRFDLTLYRQNTFDNIVDVQVPSFTGYPLAWANVGEIENKGIELSISGRPIVTKDFSYDVSFNFTRNVNTLLSLSEGIESLTGERARRLGYIRSTVGEQVGNIYGNKFLRDDQGRIVYDESGLPLSVGDQQLGNFTPDFFGGLNSTFKYKNFSLGVLLDYKIGGEILSLSNAAALANGKHKETLIGRDNPFFNILGEGVTESGEENLNFVFLDRYYGELANIAEHSLFDASFIKVRQFVLSYDLPQSFIEKTPIRGLRVGLIGRNLFFLKNGLSDLGMDPEAVYGTSGSGFEFASLPTPRSIGINLNIKL